MPSWPCAVLFDFDGVIVNSEPLHFQAFQEVLAAENFDLTEEEYFGTLIGFDDKGAFRQVYAKRGQQLSPKVFLSLMAHKSEVMMDLIHRRRLTALPGVEEFVRDLWRHCPLAICSGALREEIEVILEGVCLRDCFSIIVAAEDVTVGKPDPSGYLLAMKQLSEKTERLRPGKDKALKPADCLVVEDALSVIQSVKQAGFPTLAVTTSYSADQLKGVADWVVATLKPDEVRAKVKPLKLPR